ncbi:MAG TPA: hypothetical protein VN667_18865 [Burkholderiales bacterium]|nr:hypothetical protein [Burkholderiales bacterium]
MGSTLDPDNLISPPPTVPKGHDTNTLGPSDSSDSGSDVRGAQPVGPDAVPLMRGTNEDGASMGAGLDLDDNSDRNGTGDRPAAAETADVADRDIETDRVVSADNAGLGGGLDQAEEAQLGMTDEELADEAMNPLDANPQARPAARGDGSVKRPRHAARR